MEPEFSIVAVPKPADRLPTLPTRAAKGRAAGASRDGYVAGLLAGLVMLVMLAGSAVLISYFWPVFEVATSRPTMTPPAISQEEM